MATTTWNQEAGQSSEADVDTIIVTPVGAPSTEWSQEAGQSSETETDNVQTYVEEAEAAKLAAEAAAAQVAADLVSTDADTVATAADRVQTGLNAAATAADRVQTGLDVAATAADRVQTGLDAASTAADRVQTGLDAAATAADLVLTDADAVATAADRVQTGLDAASTAADRVQTGLDVTATAADRVQTGLDAAATAADRVQTGLDAAATAADRVQTGLDTAATAADRVQTGLDAASTAADLLATNADTVATAADRVQTGLDAASTAADRVQTGLDVTATAADRVQTGLDAASTAADRVQTGLDAASTAADRVQTGLDAAATADDRVQTGLDAAATAADRVQTGLDVVATAASASSASASADAALAALDNFDDRYLGQKASDPTLDNDGNPLIAGALYFSTTDNVMKVYDGSVWVAAYASLSGAMLSLNNLSDVDNVATSRTNLGLATVAATGAYTDLSGKPVLGTAAATASTDYATAAQGALADTALQDITGESIQNLSDVATMTPADGQALVYDTVNGWQAEDMAGGIAYTKQTAAYTIAANEGVIADTSAGSWTLTLPATPLAGDTVMVVDGADWSINNLTVARNGSTIEGDAEDMVMNIGGAAVQFTYDGTTWQTYVQVGALAGLGTTRVNFVATEGQTVFSVTYSAGFVDVYLNGIKLIAGTDFTATNGTTIVLTAGATTGDTVDVVAYSPFSVADTYTVAGADATFVNATGDTVTGDLVVTGSVTAGSFVGDGSGLTGIESVPASTVIYVAQNTAPTGYVKANGAALSRTTYATLFASIGTTFGVGDGSTTFNVPDLRGDFLRGWDDGRGVDSGRVFGSFQDHQLEEHEHLVNRRTVLENPANSSSGGGYILQDFGRANGINSNEARTVTNANAGAETRPRNVALLACIKF